jgi:hypothetical protein
MCSFQGENLCDHILIIRRKSRKVVWNNNQKIIEKIPGSGEYAFFTGFISGFFPATRPVNPIRREDASG